MLYICTKFHEEILNVFKVIDLTRDGHGDTTSLYEIKGHNYVKTGSKVTVLFLCTSSSHALYLYKVL